MHDVEIVSGQRLNRWPSKTMPRDIERAYGPSSIDPPHTAGFGVRNVEPVLPRARKHGKVEVGGGERRRQGPDELVRVFADARAVAQGGAVIDQRAHLCKSFVVSILYRI